MKRFFVSLAVAATLCLPVSAQNFVPGVFSSYEELSDAMDGAMLQADITTALMRFDGGVTSKGEALDVQTQFNRLFPRGFSNTEIVRKDVYLNGFWRELRVYWNQTSYLWVSILIHDRGDDIVAIEFSTNTDYDTVAGQF